MNVEQLVENARRAGKESQHVALAAALVELPSPVQSLCVWCADAPRWRDAPVWRLPRGGECEHCSYAGHDCIVVEGGAR